MLGVYVIPNVQSSVIQIAVRHCGVGSASYRMFRHPFQIAVYNVEWGLFHTRSSVIYSRSQCIMWSGVSFIPDLQSSIPDRSVPLWSASDQCSLLLLLLSRLLFSYPFPIVMRQCGEGFVSYLVLSHPFQFTVHH